MQIFVLDSQQVQLGPFSLAEVKQELAAGNLNQQHLAWHEGLASWVALETLIHNIEFPPENKAIIPPPPPGPTDSTLAEKKIAWYDQQSIRWAACFVCPPAAAYGFFRSNTLSWQLKTWHIIALNLGFILCVISPWTLLCIPTLYLALEKFSEVKADELKTLAITCVLGWLCSLLLLPILALALFSLIPIWITQRIDQKSKVELSIALPAGLLSMFLSPFALLLSPFALLYFWKKLGATSLSKRWICGAIFLSLFSGIAAIQTLSGNEGLRSQTANLDKMAGSPKIAPQSGYVGRSPYQRLMDYKRDHGDSDFAEFRAQIEKEIEDETIRIARQTFGVNYAHACEAVHFDIPKHSRFQLIVYLNRQYLKDLERGNSPDEIRNLNFINQQNFFSRIQTSRTYEGITEVILCIGADEIYDVNKITNAGPSTPVLEYRMSMTAIRDVDWMSMSPQEAALYIAQNGNLKERLP